MYLYLVVTAQKEKKKEQQKNKSTVLKKISGTDQRYHVKKKILERTSVINPRGKNWD